MGYAPMAPFRVDNRQEPRDYGRREVERGHGARPRSEATERGSGAYVEGGLPLVRIPWPATRRRSAKRSSGGASSAAAASSPLARAETYSPMLGPCLNPCPEPPPTTHAFSQAGWRSMTKCVSRVVSYWQMRPSATG